MLEAGYETEILAWNMQHMHNPSTPEIWAYQYFSAVIVTHSI